MMDYGLSDAEERQVFGSDDDYDYEDFEPDVDDQIKDMKIEGNWPWWK